MASATQIAVAGTLVLLVGAAHAQAASTEPVLSQSKGSGGNGISTHLGGEILRLMASVRMTHVSFKGAAPSITSLLSGDVSWVFSAILPALPLWCSIRRNSSTLSFAAKWINGPR